MMEWDWWSRMLGPSSAPKGPGRGKWWANLRNPVLPQPNPRWRRRRPQSFGVLQDVDLDLVHVKTLEEILQEKEAKKRSEQAATVTAKCSIQETMRGDLRMVQCQDQNPVHRIRLGQFNEEKEDEEPVEVVMDTAESNDEESDGVYCSPEELFSEEHDRDTDVSSLDEEGGHATVVSEEEMILSELGDENFLRVDVESDQSCQEKSGEDAGNLDSSQDDFDFEDSDRSVDEDTDKRSLEGERKNCQVEEEISDNDQEDMDADEALKQDYVQVDGTCDQNCHEEYETDIKSVVSSSDDFLLADLEIDLDKEAESVSLQKECEAYQQGTTDSAHAIKDGGREAVKQDNLLVGLGEYNESCLKEVQDNVLDPCENASSPREPKSDASQVTNDDLQDEESIMTEGDEEMVYKDNKNEDEDKEPLQQLHLQLDAGCNVNFHKESEYIEYNSSSDEFCPKEHDGSVDEETSSAGRLQKEEECQTVQIEIETIYFEKSDRDEDAGAVEQMCLQVDAGSHGNFQEEAITEDRDGSQDTDVVDISTSCSRHGVMQKVDLQVKNGDCQICQEENNQHLEADLPVNTRADFVETTKTQTDKKRGESEVKKAGELDETLDESSQEDEVVLDECVGNFRERDKKEMEEGPGSSWMVDDCKTDKSEVLHNFCNVDTLAGKKQGTENTADKESIEECLPRALRDKEIITPHVVVHPVTGDRTQSTNVHTVNNHKVIVADRPYTRKRKNEEMMQGWVQFLKVRQKGAKTEVPIMTRDKRTRQRQVKNDEIGQGAMVGDQDSILGSLEVPRTRQQQAREAAEPKRRGRPCLRPKEKGEKNSLKSGQTKEVGPDSKVAPHQLRKSRSMEQVGKDSKKQQQTNQVGRHVGVTPMLLRTKKGGIERGKVSKMKGPTNDVEVASSSTKDRGEDSLKKGQTKQAGHNSADALSPLGKSRRKEIVEEDSMKKRQTQHVEPDSGAAPSQHGHSRPNVSVKKGQTEQFGPEAAPSRFRKSRYMERGEEDSVRKEQKEEVIPDAEVEQTNLRESGHMRKEENVSMKLRQTEEVSTALSHMSKSRPTKRGEKDTVKKGQTKQVGLHEEVSPIQLRKSRSKESETEGPIKKGQLEQVRPDSEVGQSQLRVSSPNGKEEDASIKTRQLGPLEQLGPRVDVAPSQLEEKRSKKRVNKESNGQGQTNQLGADSKFTQSQVRKIRSNERGEADFTKKEVGPFSEIASSPLKKNRPKEIEKEGTIKIGKTEEVGLDEEVAPSQIRKRRFRESEEDSEMQGQTEEVRLDTDVAPSQIRKRRFRESEEDSEMQGQTEEVRLDTDVAPSQIRKRRFRESEEDSEMQGQTEEVRLDTDVAPSQIRKSGSRRKVKEIKTNQDHDHKEPEKRLNRCRSKVDILVADGKQLQSCLEGSDHTREAEANVRQPQTGEKRKEEEGDKIQRNTLKLKRDGCTDEDTSLTVSPEYTSREKTESNGCSTETTTVQKRGKKLKQSAVISLQLPSNMVAEAADVNQGLHIANEFDKVELKLSSSVQAAKEGQSTESGAAETPCQDGINVKQGGTRRRGLRKKVVSQCTCEVQAKKKRKRDENLHSPRWEDGASSSKKRKRILKIKIPSPKNKRAMVSKSVPCISPIKDSAGKVDATLNSDKNIVEDRGAKQEHEGTEADMSQDRVPYHDTMPQSDQNLGQDNRVHPELNDVNADQLFAKSVRVPFPDATPESDQNFAQDVKLSEELECTIKDRPHPGTGRVPYLDATPDSVKNLFQAIQVNQEPEGKRAEYILETNRVPFLDTTSDSDQNVIQDPGICRETKRENADLSFFNSIKISYIDTSPESDKIVVQDVNQELKEATANKSLSEASRNPYLNSSSELDKNAVQDIAVHQELKKTNSNQSLSETLGIPFAQILANQPRVLLHKLNFKVSIPLDCATLKTRKRRGRGHARKMTWNQLGFKKPSQLTSPVNKALSDESTNSHLPSTSQAGHSILGQENRSPFPATYRDSDSADDSVRNKSDADYLDCSGEIVEAPEVADTVEVVSTDIIPLPTANGSVEVSLQDVAVLSLLPTSDPPPIERVTSQSEHFACDQESCQLCEPDDKCFDYELNSQVQIINSEYEAMGLRNSVTDAEDCTNLCFRSPSMKVVVTPLAPSGCTDVPLVSLTSTSQTGAERDPSYPNTLPSMQIFLSKMSESEQTSSALQSFVQNLSENLSGNPDGVTEDVGASLDSDTDDYMENSSRQESTSESESEAGTSTPNENSETEEEASISHQERASSQSPEGRGEVVGTGDENCDAVSGSRVQDSIRKATDTERIQVSAVTSPPSQDVLDGVLDLASPRPLPQSPPTLSSSPCLNALLTTATNTSFCVVTPHNSPSLMLEREDLENIPKNYSENLGISEKQKTPQNGATNAVSTSSAIVVPLAASLEDEEPDSRNVSSQFGDLTLPPLDEDFEFPDEDCLSLVCDTESFLNELSDELMEIDRKISDTEKTKSGSPSQCRNRPLGTRDTNNQLGKSGPLRKEIASPRGQPPIHTVDWSEMEQYQPISSDLAGGDCSTNDLRGFVQRNEGHSTGTQEARLPSLLGRNWTATQSPFQGSGNAQPQPQPQPQPGLRNQLIPRGFCYDFVRKGCCGRRACPYVHSKPNTATRTQCPPPPSRNVFKNLGNRHENLLAVVNECNMALDVHFRGRQSTEQGGEERDAASLESEGSASPAAMFEAAYRLQQCSSWREIRETLLDICQRRPEVVSCQPVVKELLGKLSGSPEVLGEKFGNFVAVFKRHLAENANDLATESLKQALSRLGISSAQLCCNSNQWGQARYILDCLYNHGFPCPGELAPDVLRIKQLLSKHKPPNLPESCTTPCAKGV